jgi:hypothetical protein
MINHRAHGPHRNGSIAAGCWINVGTVLWNGKQQGAAGLQNAAQRVHRIKHLFIRQVNEDGRTQQPIKCMIRETAKVGQTGREKPSLRVQSVPLKGIGGGREHLRNRLRSHRILSELQQARQIASAAASHVQDPPTVGECPLEPRRNRRRCLVILACQPFGVTRIK